VVRFAAKPLLEPRVVGEVPGQALDRDRALELEVVGAVDLAHPAPAEQLVEPVGAEDLRVTLHDPPTLDGNPHIEVFGHAGGKVSPARQP